jgi:hypothetical protein
MGNRYKMIGSFSNLSLESTLFSLVVAHRSLVNGVVSVGILPAGNNRNLAFLQSSAATRAT